jgi:DnaJ-class molecular chaperone
MSAESEIPPEETCRPCRGTGRLTSGLGGEPHEVQCPWCQGTGRPIPGIDAQQAPAETSPPPGPES